MQQAFLNPAHVYQSMLASYCRSGISVAIPGVDAGRVHQYRSLVYQVMDDMLRNAYPIACGLLPEEEWDRLVSGFMTNHNCSSPQVWCMPGELISYLSGPEHPVLARYPVLKDLLRFEWLEVELFMMEDIPAKYRLSGDVASDRLILNPEHRLVLYSYPVHTRNAVQIEDKHRGKYYLAAHRHPLHHNVMFTDLSPALLRMLEYLDEAPASLAELLDLFADEYQIDLAESDKAAVHRFFEDAFHKRLVIGFQA